MHFLIFGIAAALIVSVAFKVKMVIGNSGFPFIFDLHFCTYILYSWVMFGVSCTRIQVDIYH